MLVHIRVPVHLVVSPAIPHIPEHEGFLIVAVEAETTHEATTRLSKALTKLASEVVL